MMMIMMMILMAVVVTVVVGLGSTKQVNSYSYSYYSSLAGGSSFSRSGRSTTITTSSRMIDRSVWLPTTTAAAAAASGSRTQLFAGTKTPVTRDNYSDDSVSTEPPPYGTVVRTARRSYQKDGNSKPSGQNYTTRKDEPSNDERDQDYNDGRIVVTYQGIKDGYNHYRTVALKGTRDRAVSIWTTDVLEWLHQYDYYQDIQVGDFGENLSIAGVNYTYFQVGQQYQFVSSSGSSNNNHHENNYSNLSNTTLVEDRVIIQITEPMIPCANLCKLPYINRPDLSPQQRIEKCQQLLAVLDRDDGLRGWYAKVIQTGTIRSGDIVQHKKIPMVEK